MSEFINTLFQQTPLWILLIIANAAGDRLRGSGGTYFLSSALFGAAVFVLCLFVIEPQQPAWLPLLVLVAYLAGESFGWGEPMAAALSGKPMRPNKLENWQFGPLARHPVAWYRAGGFMWAVPMSAVYGWAGYTTLAYAVLLAFTVAMPLSVLIARRFTHLKHTTSGIVWQNWERSEIIRGALVMLIIVLLAY